MSHDNGHDHGIHSKAPHNDHGGGHKLPPLHTPETLIADNEDTVHEKAPKNISNLLLIGALILAGLSLCYAILNHYQIEQIRLNAIGYNNDPRHFDEMPDWLKAKQVDGKGKPLYPDPQAKLAENADAKRTEKKIGATSAPPRDAGTDDAAAPAEEEDDHGEKPSQAAPVAAPEPSANDDGLTYLVKSGDNLTSIGQNMKPKFCGVIGDNKVPGGRPGMFAKKVMEANQSPIAKGFQALPTPTALRAGLKIHLPAECKKESSASTPPAE